MSLITIRDRMAQAAPSWLQGYWGSRLLYAIGLHLDAMVDWASAAVHARFPTWCATNMPDALVVHGQDRGIRRGFAESLVAWAARLAMWWPTRRQRGSLYAMMDQLAGYMSGYSVKMRAVNLNGAWMTRNADGSREYHRASPSNWLWDVFTAQWSRYWIIVYPPSNLWVERGSWGDNAGKTWADMGANGGTFDTTITTDQVDTIRDIVSEWNPPHARCLWVILATDPASFDPPAPPDSAGLPGNTTPWTDWGLEQGGHYQAIRLQTAHYMIGMEP